MKGIDRCPNGLNVRQAMAKIEDLEKKVKEHPMCLNLNFYGDHYVAMLPNPVRGRVGLMARTEIGKAKALEKLLEGLETAWRQDLPVMYPDEP